VLLAHGDAVDDGINPEWWWGESALMPAASAIADASGARSAATHLMQEANVDVVRTEGLLNRMETVAGREQLLKAAFLMKTSKSNFGLLMLDKGQEYSRNAYSFGGVKDIVEIQHALVAAAADIPITRLLGRSPAGMNATGESDMLNYFQMLMALQESMLSPCMASLDEALIRSALGDMRKGLWYDWRRPDTLTEEQRVKHAETRAKTVKEYAATGLVPEPVMEDAVRAMLIETGDLIGAEAAYEKWDEAGNEIDFAEIDEPEPPPVPGAVPPDPNAQPVPEPAAA
jgi:phage-related protein (TIGR01555 family)